MVIRRVTEHGVFVVNDKPRRRGRHPAKRATGPAMKTATASSSAVNEPGRPVQRSSLNIGILIGSGVRVGCFKKRAKSRGGAQVVVRDVHQVGGNLGEGTNGGERIRMAGELAVFEVSPAPSAEDEDSVVLPASGNAIKASAGLRSNLSDEGGEPAGEKAPTTRAETLLESAGARRAARIPPDGDRGGIAALETGGARGPNSEERRGLILDSADEATVRVRKAVGGAAGRLHGSEGRQRKRTAWQISKLGGRAQAALEALARGAAKDKADAKMRLYARIVEQQDLPDERRKSSTHDKEINNVLAACRQSGGVDDAAHHLGPLGSLKVIGRILPIRGDNPQPIKGCHVPAASFEERSVLRMGEVEARP